jgi:hypothetical protein
MTKLAAAPYRLEQVDWVHAPEQQLIAAVLELAVDDLKQATAGEAPRGNDEHQLPDREASLSNTVRWFESKSSQRPLSFRWCCKALGLDADQVLSRLRAQTLPV